MNEFLSELLMTVITAAVPVLSAYAITLIRKARDKAAAQTDSIKQQDYISEIADAISVAVATTSQTYVDALKKTGSFTKEAQAEAAQKALTTCIASICRFLCFWKALRPRRPLLRQVRQPLPLLLLHRQRFSRLPLSRLLLKRSTDDTVRAPYRAYSLYYSEHLF